MNVCTCQEMQQAEQRLIHSGIPALDLMENAAARMTAAISTSFPVPGRCIAYLGKGNNAGDAVAVLRRLAALGWHVSARCAYPVEQWGELLRTQYDGAGGALPMADLPPVPQPGESLLLLDGLLGLGARGTLSPEIELLCREMNTARASSGAVRTWSIDLPTGLDGDTGQLLSNDAVVADYTAVIGAVKKGLLADEATRHVGRLVPVSMDGLVIEHPANGYLLEPKLFSRLLRPRPYDMYKNQAGHVGIIAGSPGLLGAARLCSEAALKAGAGLVTLHCTREMYPILAASTIPEVIVKPVQSYDDCELDRFDSFLIGPGLGQVGKQTAVSIGMILKHFDGPIVLDADGLNLVASERIFLRESILATPHPGEMARFLPQSVQHASREEIVHYFTGSQAAAVLYKGARSIVSQSGSPLYYNGTGGPAMATAGQGDVLAGVCAALCAQKMTPLMSGCLGAHLCGLASDIELSEGRQTERSLTAGDTLRALPKAMIATSRGIV